MPDTPPPTPDDDAVVVSSAAAAVTVLGLFGLPDFDTDAPSDFFFPTRISDFFFFFFLGAMIILGLDDMMDALVLALEVDLMSDKSGMKRWG
jgi:hypothetical protein